MDAMIKEFPINSILVKMPRWMEALPYDNAIIKEIVEEATINKNTHNLTLMNTIYNISKIIYNIIDAEFIFATNETLYRQGKCGVSIYKEKQLNKINSKKEDNIDDVIKNLKEQATINLPTIFFCSFEQLRTFYFELDEVIYGKEDENDG